MLLEVINWITQLTNFDSMNRVLQSLMLSAFENGLLTWSVALALGQLSADNIFSTITVASLICVSTYAFYIRSNLTLFILVAHYEF